jgi:aminopeptidase N
MDWFFDQWIHRGGEPIYAVNWNVRANLGDNNSANVNDLFPQGQYDVEINVKQTQNQDIVVGLFRMPVDIEFLYFDGSSEKRTVWVEKSQHSFHFKTQKAPMTVVFDAGSRILKTLEMQKSPAEWHFQMEHGSSMLDRYDALVALRGTVAIHRGIAAHAGLGGSSDQTRSTGLIDFKTVLEQAWNREKFREMQVEIATQWLSLPGVFATTSNVKLNQGELASVTSENTANQNAIVLQKLANSGHSSVRKVLFERLPLEANFKELFLIGLKDSSYSNSELVVTANFSAQADGDSYSETNTYTFVQ